ncbi:Protein of unknown function [Jatrophihabitans endophyticus]|uniref:DUF4233 domain-containing protein n=1 Tax=Jatrophihabitans endophyticus TaxID=1206085 RepID=A0A1M5UQ64_9ACTN|nr:DUF4233 domain-containing protein [Jatrophihabitans endophyticus]SHH65026.1 Protein of unknown function [Jatrophihabitans endophyticus]
MEDIPEDAPAAPTPEQYAARARRANKATRGALAAVLALEALVILLVPRAIKFTSGLGTTRTVVLFVLAALLVVGAASTRRSWGVGFGSVLQLAFVATGFFLGSLFLVGAIFAAIWLRILMLRHEVVGTAGGLRMLVE